MSDIPPRLKRLDEALSALPLDCEAMLLSELDGFIAGILVCPDLVMPGEWLSVVWAGDDPEAPPAFDDPAQAERLTGLVMEHYNATVADLRRGDYGPVFDVDTRNDEIMWEPWLEGFETAMALRPDAWAALDGDAAETALAGLLTLAEIARGDTDLSRDEAEELSRTAPDLIPLWVETLDAWRLGAADGGAPERPAVRGARVGRNEPCPCGSGRKYKRCCGAN